MGILKIVLIDIVIAILAFFAESSTWQLVTYHNFTVPFTRELIAKRVIKPELKKKILVFEGISIYLSVIVLNGLCVLGGIYTLPSGFIVYAAVFILSFLIFRPSEEKYTESIVSVTKYVNNHRVFMEMERFHKIYSKYREIK